MGKKSTLRYYAYISSFKVDQLFNQLGEFNPTKVKVTTGRETEASAHAGISKILAFLSADFGYGDRRKGSVEIEGETSPVQRLNAVLAHIRSNEVIKDLNLLCANEAGEPLDAFAYTYSGMFTALGQLNREEEEDPFRRSGGVYLSGAAIRKAPDEIVISKTALLEPALSEARHLEYWSHKSKTRLVSDVCLLLSVAGKYNLQLACSYKYFSDMGGQRHGKSPDDEWEVVPHSGNYLFFEGVVDAYFETLLFINDVRGKYIFGTPLFLLFGSNPDLRI